MALELAPPGQRSELGPDGACPTGCAFELRSAERQCDIVARSLALERLLNAAGLQLHGAAPNPSSLEGLPGRDCGAPRRCTRRTLVERVQQPECAAPFDGD